MMTPLLTAFWMADKSWLDGWEPPSDMLITFTPAATAALTPLAMAVS